MPGVENKAIAEIISQMAQGSNKPVKDGVLRQAISPYTYDSQGQNFESVPGGTLDQTHPDAGPGPRPAYTETPLMAVSTGAAPRTRPSALEGVDFGAPRLSHTGGEKGLGVLTADPQAMMEMLMAMGIPEPMIAGVLREMGYQYGS